MQLTRYDQSTLSSPTKRLNHRTNHMLVILSQVGNEERFCLAPPSEEKKTQTPDHRAQKEDTII
ncbi:hypothetical protein C5167_005701 [Papaver somniferum]|uniref:Uncharacterized protein n=1 Tax=Papaver somniferum TaxID=3469 RepID=A0A4Y7JB89_PAPSO|nr:hypothetical protein C5167_005701 [Papaver somniferum]